MKGTLKSLVALSALALVASPLFAQVQIQIQPGKRLIAPGGVGGINYYMLNQKAVQEDLGFTKEQQEKMQKAVKDRTEAFKEIRNVPVAQRRQKYAEINQNYQKAMKGLLTKDQNKRLEQIQFQMFTQRGLTNIFYRADYAKKIGITAEQKQKAQELQKEQRQAIQALPRGNTAEDRQNRIKALQEIQKQTSEKVEKLLTKEQQDKLKELRGKPFKGLNNRGGGVIRPLPLPAPIPGRPIQIKPIQGKPGNVLPIKPGKIRQIKPGRVIQIKPGNIKIRKIQIQPLPAKKVKPAKNANPNG